MEPILTRCGYRCDLCLAYAPNIERNPSNQQVLSDGWFKYFGFRLPPSEIRCDGCMSQNPYLIDKSCPVRPCVIAKQLENCSLCEDYLCNKLRQRLVVYEEVKQRVGADIPDADYNFFIKPYENKLRLGKLRAARKGKRGPRAHKDR
ncbi:MAG: hypothetical protein C4K47_01985 [Candidatus Thorarchaeota archaeon]|nr:MAG: hypothetical protein C4K47_01985 [Candidatus Thorarchaeota archaeon]